MVFISTDGGIKVMILVVLVDTGFVLVVSNGCAVPLDLHDDVIPVPDSLASLVGVATSAPLDTSDTVQVSGM